MADGLNAACFFCDDIRQEPNGKQIHIGVYNRDLIVPALPATFEKMMLVVTLRAPLQHPQPEELTARIQIPDQPEQSFKVGVQQLPEEQSPSDAQTWEIRLIFGLRLQCVAEGRIKVNIDTDVGSAFAGSLRIRTQDTAQAHAVDLTGLSNVLYHFIESVEPKSPLEDRNAAVALRNVLTDLVRGKAETIEYPNSPITVALLSGRECYVLFKEPQRKPIIEIKYRDKLLPYRIDRKNPYYVRLALIDEEGPTFANALEIDLVPASPDF
ncbi:MAG: hypothetical protein E6Q98_02850 [Rhodospirillaceae bacterium]|nr:MAG: hypothetical protein E6Q98_02850 [Rhodospirillaceae bacterium]